MSDYKDLKAFICTGCGEEIMLTKFASQKTCKCEKCKTNGVPSDPKIVELALGKSVKTAKVHVGVVSQLSGDTKDVPCIKCGNMVTVTKFASAKKTLCDDCKSIGVKADDVIMVDGYHSSDQLKPIEVDPTKIDWTQIKPLEEYRINDIIMANKKLQKVICPACGHEHMKIIMVIDKSQFGLIVKYQCPSCLLLVTLSEQTKELLKPMIPGHRYDYHGDEIKELSIGTMESTRISNAISKMIKLCEDNDIEIVGDEMDPYYYKEEKPVPTGFIIPQEDKIQFAIGSVLNVLNNATRQGNIVDEPEGSRFITISDTLVKKLVLNIKELLKED